MDYQFKKINIINELSEEEKEYRNRVMEKYKRDVSFIENIEVIFLFFAVSSALGITFYIFGGKNEKTSVFIFFILLIIFFTLCELLVYTKQLEKLLNSLALINTIGNKKDQIELIKMQMEIEKIFIPFASPDYNPIGFEVTDRTSEITQRLENIYISFEYVAKNLVTLDVVENQFNIKIARVVKNCSVIVPTLDIAEVKLILPADEKGNLLEEKKSKGVDSN